MYNDLQQFHDMEEFATLEMNTNALPFGTVQIQSSLNLSLLILGNPTNRASQKKGPLIWSIWRVP
jgi:hypothetical protein